MFLKLSKGHVNLHYVVGVFTDENGRPWLDTADGSRRQITTEDMAIVLAAISPPPPPSATLPAPPVIDDKVAALVEAAAESYYKAQDRDQTIDFDATSDAPGEDEWPWWEGVRRCVRSLTGIELIETADSAAVSAIREWRAAGCPPPTVHRFDLPYGITVTRVPSRGPGDDKRYSGAIGSALYDHLVGPEAGTARPGLQRAIDALEGLILAHACEGIDIGAPAYVAGVVTAVEQTANEFT